MSEELSCISDRRARKAVIEAGYDTLEKAYRAGHREITDLKYVGGQTWDEIVAEWNLRARAVAAELGQDDPPPGEPAELPLPPVVYGPPAGDPQEAPEDENFPVYSRPIGAIPASAVNPPDAGGEIVHDDPAGVEPGWVATRPTTGAAEKDRESPKKLRADLDCVIAHLRGHDVVLP